MFSQYIPILLTLSRGMLVFPYFYTQNNMVKLIIVGLAIFSDFLDGYLARRFAVSTKWGENFSI